MGKYLEVVIDLRSLDKLAKGFKGYRKMLTKELKRALKRTVLDIEATAKERCPVDTGRLRASITPDVVGATEGYVGTNVSYAAAVEYGSRPHEIRPRKAKALAWKDRQTGEQRFARKVNHPGTAAQPFLEPAFLDGQKAAQKHFNAAFERLKAQLERVLK